MYSGCGAGICEGGMIIFLWRWIHFHPLFDICFLYLFHSLYKHTHSNKYKNSISDGLSCRHPSVQPAAQHHTHRVSPFLLFCCIGHFYPKTQFSILFCVFLWLLFTRFSTSLVYAIALLLLLLLLYRDLSIYTACSIMLWFSVRDWIYGTHKNVYLVTCRHSKYYIGY